MSRTIVALDLGSITGFAVKSRFGFSSGVLNFKKRGKFHASGFLALYDFLRTFTDSHEYVEVVVEKPHAGRFLAPIRILFGLLAITHLFCDCQKLHLTEYSPKEIKKFWTGSGKAKKEEMVLETQKRFPNVKDHNQSDAIALLYLHLDRTE